MADRGYLERLAKRLADDGRLIEAGFIAMRLRILSLDTDPAELRKLRLVYLAGAQHLFSSMIQMLDPDKEPTAADLRRMDLLHHELEAARPELEAWAQTPREPP